MKKYPDITPELEEKWARLHLDENMLVIDIAKKEGYNSYIVGKVIGEYISSGRRRLET